MEEKLIFEHDSTDRRSISLPDSGFEYTSVSELLDPDLVNSEACKDFPELSEPEIARHYTRISTRNFHIDRNLYPLGSCTMKYNPKVNEYISRFKNFTDIHPLQDEKDIQGTLRILFELGEFLKDLSGLPGVTLQPAAGAHGELTGLLLLKAYHRDRDPGRKVILIPDSAHGTNPASAKMAGFEVKQIKSDENGDTDIEDLKKNLGEDFAGIMLTIPNTLGLFDKNILEISRLVHESGGLLYMDGANMNALMGKVKPVDLGVDVMHFNLHKTFSTPHGGGGPGSGPITVSSDLEPYLPHPTILRNDSGEYSFNYSRPKSIGKIKEFYGNVGVALKAYVYFKSLGINGLRKVTETAVLNANYLKKSLEEAYTPAYDRPCMHECVLTNQRQAEFGIKTLHIAKRLLDYGIHAPTIYFPLIVQEAIMIEPTETESKETLDRFIEVLKNIDRECQKDPDLVKTAPHNCFRKKLDEVGAARNPVLRWSKEV